MPVHPVLFLFHPGVSRNSWNLRRQLQGQELSHLRSKGPLQRTLSVLPAPIRDMIETITDHHMMAVIPLWPALLMTGSKLHLTMRCSDTMALLGMAG